MYGVYIGRFQPIHVGHQKIIDEMIEMCGIDSCIVMIGSSNTHDNKNIFTYKERASLIKELYPNLKIVSLPDQVHDACWYQQVEDVFTAIFNKTINSDDDNVTFFGGSSEDTYYVHDANWTNTHIVDRLELPISATFVRKCLAENDLISLKPCINEKILYTVLDYYSKMAKE